MGKARTVFEVLLGCYVSSEMVGKVYLQTIFLYSGRDDMDMLVLGIVVAHHDIGLFPIAHVMHICFGQFKKVSVFQIFATGKVEGSV
jgi:hypothetical protein